MAFSLKTKTKQKTTTSFSFTNIYIRWVSDWYRTGKANFCRTVTDNINNACVCGCSNKVIWCCHCEKKILLIWKPLNLKWTFQIHFHLLTKFYRQNIWFSTSLVLRVKIVLFEIDDNSIYWCSIHIFAYFGVSSVTLLENQCDLCSWFTFSWGITMTKEIDRNLEMKCYSCDRLCFNDVPNLFYVSCFLSL